ncbi:hypothetical protein BHM03_00007875 [Ensete ventricosum]|nr:hypothetical protein BHM03_00007875 [Ensete ventricosum]
MGRRFFSPHGEKKSPVGDESCDAGRPSDGSRDAGRNPGSPLLLPPSTETARNRSMTVEIDRYQSTSCGNRRRQLLLGSTAW